MCLASLVKNVFFWRFIMLLSKEYRLSNIMTQSLEERQGDTPLDCFCCSCVFGKLWNSTLLSLFSVLDVFFFLYRLQNCPLFSVYALFFHPSMLIPPVSCHLSTSLSHSSLHSPPTLSFDKVLWGLCCWPLPSRLHNNPIRLPESLLG